jgi:hypothetical protein
LLADVQDGRVVEGGLPGKLGGPDAAAFVAYVTRDA